MSSSTQPALALERHANASINAQHVKSPTSRHQRHGLSFCRNHVRDDEIIQIRWRHALAPERDLGQPFEALAQVRLGGAAQG